MAMAWTASKDPDDIKDYVLDWTPRLAGDYLETSEWTIVTGDTLVIDSDTHTESACTVWFSGGIDGDAYILNRVTTTGGRTYDQTMKLKIKTK
jgi:hypothetical protein